MLQLLGIASGILVAISYIPYIKDIFLRTTKPERASWFIWAVLGGIAFFSQLAEGASWSLWLTVVETIGVLIVFLLSLRYGVGGWTRRDLIALTAAMIGLVFWYLFHHAYIALFITIAIDIIGASLTVIKAYQDPGSETLSTWVFVSLAGILGMIAVGNLDLVLLSYPCYIFLSNVAVVIAMLLGKIKTNTKLNHPFL